MNNEFQNEDQFQCDKIDISDFINEQISNLRNKSISVKKFNKIINDICKKFNVDENSPLMEYSEDKLMETLENNKIKATL